MQWNPVGPRTPHETPDARPEHGERARTVPASARAIIGIVFLLPSTLGLVILISESVSAGSLEYFDTSVWGWLKFALSTCMYFFGLYVVCIGRLPRWTSRHSQGDAA